LIKLAIELARVAIPEAIPLNNTMIPHRPLRSRSTLRFACLAVMLFSLATVGQTQLLPPPPPSPTPAQQPASPAVIARVTAAKTIFLSNAGGNNYFNGEIPGGPNVSYNELYAALQQWGYFQLVSSPAHADLIFQIRGTELAPNLAPSPDGQHVIAQQHQPQLELTILDPATLSLIDSITAPAGRANSVPKGTIAFARSIEWLTYQISTRVSAPRSNPTDKLASRDTLRPSFETLVKFTAPVPPQVLTAKNIYVVNDAPASNPAHDRYFQGFTTALTTWSYYHLTDSAQSADLVFHFHDDQANGTWVTLNDPTTKAILWTITDPHYGFYHQGGKHRVAALNQNLISRLKQLNNIPLTPSETAALR
jgi:hypothetical protein